MRMLSVKSKTQVYVFVFSLVVSVVGLVFMLLSMGAPSADEKAMTQAQKLEALEQSAPRSPAMAGFLQNEKSRREADQEVNPR
jgi:hypothetical protein